MMLFICIVINTLPTTSIKTHLSMNILFIAFYCITYPPAVVFFAVHLEKTIIADNVAGHVFLVINFPFYGHISGYIFICLLPHALKLIQEKFNVFSFH